jgi:hypothetical protein
LLVAFQNCSRVNFSSLDSVGATFRSNNGTGYSGKPSADYYRFHPEFTCENKTSAVSELHVVVTSAVFIENRRLQCGAVQQTLDVSKLDSSVYQHDIVGFNEGIFESETSTPESIPANLVEVWCQTPKGLPDAPKIETITHFNRQTLAAETDLYYPGTNAPVKRTFAVSRIAAAQKVTVRGERDFVLEVFRDQPAAEFGLFRALMTVQLDGSPTTMTTACRLGGSLDPQIWPAKEIVDAPVTLFKLAANLQFFGFTSSLATEPNRLFIADASGQNLKILSPMMLKNGVQNFEFAPDLAHVFYWGDPRYTGGNELFRVDRSGANTLQMNALLTNSKQGLATEIQFSADGSRVFYRDGQQETGTEGGMDIEMWLRSVPSTGGAPLVVNPPLPLVGDFGVYDFKVSPSQNRVAYLAGGSAADLYVANLDGTIRFKPFGNTTFENYALLRTPAPGMHLFIDALQSGPGGNLDHRSYAVAFADGHVTALPADATVREVDPAGRAALLSGPGGTVQRMDLQTATLTNLAVLDKPFFAIDGQRIYAGQPRSDGLFMPTLTSISATGLATTQGLCAGIAGNALVMKETTFGDLVIAVYHLESSLLEVYQRNGTGECARRNSLPLEVPAEVQFELLLAPDQQKVLVRANERIYFVPLNGQPSLAVNAPIFAAAKVNQVTFLPDSRSVLYVGDQQAAGVKNVFLWKAP